MNEPTATMHEIADLSGCLAAITGGWSNRPVAFGNRNGDAVLRAIGMPSIQPYIDRLHEIIADIERLKQDDGS